MGKKYKTRADAMTALGAQSLQESLDGPLARTLGKKILDMEVDAIVAMQSKPMVGVPILSMIGSGQLILVVNCLVRWCDSTGLAWRPSFVSSVMLCYNGIAKAILKGPRPYWLSEKVKTLDPTLETSYGFPSGHSTGVFAIYGIMVYHYNISWLYVVWIVVSCAVMYSRVYTGAHFHHDVLGGAVMGLTILGADVLNEWYLSVSGARGSITEMFLLCLISAATFCTVLYVAGWTGRAKFMTVYEGVSGAGFALGLALCHLFELLMPPPCDENPPLPFHYIVVGLVGVVAADKLMKRLPEYPDGTRDFWCLVLTTLGFAGIMVWTTWLVPRMFTECPVSDSTVVIHQQ